MSLSLEQVFLLIERRNMRVSFSAVGSILFLLFIANSVYNLIGIFRTPTCSKNEVCYVSYLNSRPPLDLRVYTSDNSRFGNLNLIQKVKNFKYWQEWTKDMNITVSKSARNNGSLFIHILLIPSGKYHDDMSLKEFLNIPDVTYLKRKIIAKVIPARVRFNLLNEEASKDEVLSTNHLMSKLAIVICTEKMKIPPTKIPIEVMRHVRIYGSRQILPMVEQDVMQTRLRDLTEITPESQIMPLTLMTNPISFGKFRFMLQIEQTLEQFKLLGFSDKDLDEVKGVFADTNLYLLVATIFISSIHLLFDFLAFKNDISFWRNQTTTAGLSTRTILWRAFSQTIIFLYLLDEGTSLLVLVPSGIAVLIEFWKVSKAMKTRFVFKEFRFIKDSTETDEELQTRLYDEECMRYFALILYPLCIGAAVYSLIYYPHKSWYSWIINSLANGVYAFGFLFMLPQLFVNYKLKSVAALPWRAFTYRAFNTFIDDIFAFIIPMPTAHRMACFRDDIVFFIYLYQRWLYPVDTSRRSDNILSQDDCDDKKNQ